MENQKGLQYTPTCYEQVVIDLKADSSANLKISDYPEFKLRGHSKKEFEAWVAHSKLALFLSELGGNDNAKKAYQQAMFAYVSEYHKSLGIHNHPEKMQEAALKIGRIKQGEILDVFISKVELDAARLKIPKYRLLPEEIETLKKAEQLGRGKDTILNYKDTFGEKDAKCYNYLEYPVNEGGRVDVAVVFSGHQQTGTRFLEFFYPYMLKYIDNVCQLVEKIRNFESGSFELFQLLIEFRKQRFYMASLGMTDNQGLTDWSPEFFFRKLHEYYMYFAHATYGGVPKGITEKLLMYEVKDTDTAQNFIFLENTLKHYHLDDVNLIFIGYPVYQMRVMTEMAKAFSKSGVNVHIRIADIPTKPFSNEEEAVMALKNGDISEEEFEALDFDSYRLLSYDNLEMQCFDLISNCVANIYRENQGKEAKRFKLPGYNKFPKQLKSLIQLALAYSYKNIPNELCGTDQTVALALKLNRTAMLIAHDKGYSGKVQEKQQQFYAEQTNKRLVRQEVISEKLLKKSKEMGEEEFILALAKEVWRF